MSTVQAAATAAVVAIGNAIVTFAIIGQTQATAIENAVIGVVALGFVIGQAIENHGKALAGRPR